MSSPYINTYLYGTVSLHPSQMDNDIYKHLKTNLTRKMQGKCYKSYGYISKIYKIEERAGGYIVAEDPSASATYEVKFSAKICRPLPGSIVVCEVMSINKEILMVRNGPIYILIFEGNGNINQTNFVYDDRKNVLLSVTNGDKGVPVVKGSFVNIKVIQVKIEDGSDKILVFGTLESMATQEEQHQSIVLRESDDGNFVDYDKYIESGTKQNEEDSLMTETTDETITPDDDDDDNV